jgi:hypothetical protein
MADQFIYVTAGAVLAPGQCAIMEEDPAHPYVPSPNPNAQGAHKAVIVKDDPTCHGGYVGMTRLVSVKISHGELERTSAPADAEEPYANAEDAADDEAAMKQATLDSRSQGLPPTIAPQRQAAPPQQKPAAVPPKSGSSS